MGAIEIFLGVLFPLFVGTGIALATAGTDSGEFVVARVCFVIAAIDAAALTVWWIYSSRSHLGPLTAGRPRVSLPLHQEIVARRAAVDGKRRRAARRGRAPSRAKTSQICSAIASSVARATSARVVASDAPVRAARARSFQCGAPRPASAGTKQTSDLPVKPSPQARSARRRRAGPSIPPSMPPPGRRRNSRLRARRRLGRNGAQVIVVDRPERERSGASVSVISGDEAGAGGRFDRARPAHAVAEQGGVGIAHHRADRNAGGEPAHARPSRRRRRRNPRPSAARGQAHRTVRTDRRSTAARGCRTIACATRCSRRSRGLCRRSD